MFVFLFFIIAVVVVVVVVVAVAAAAAAAAAFFVLRFFLNKLFVCSLALSLSCPSVLSRNRSEHSFPARLEESKP